MLMVGLCSHNFRKSSCCAEATGTVGTAGAFTNEEACHLVFGGKLFVQGGSCKTYKDERRPLLGDISLGAVAGGQQPRRSKGYHKLSVKYLYIGYQTGIYSALMSRVGPHHTTPSQNAVKMAAKGNLTPFKFQDQNGGMYII